MLLLARRIANRFDPGTGTLVAVALGLVHVHVAARDRRLRARARRHARCSSAFAIADCSSGMRVGVLLPSLAAGALAGFAVTTEYPAALIAAS